jgi:RNA-directed DNA polymerase
MKTYKNLYEKVYHMGNLIISWRRARKHKTTKSYVIEFEKIMLKNLFILQYELKNKTYKPIPLKTFILRDPKTRKISKSDFRDRVIHHALCRVIEPIFQKAFIYDSCANIKGKGNLFALKRFDLFKRKITKNNTKKAYVLKADIKHYFDEVNHEVLLNIIKRKINDDNILWLVKQILNNFNSKTEGKGMPLGNLTSQFFANVYLNELDYFVKHQLKAKYYIRYVDDFVIPHNSKEQLEVWKDNIDNFLKKELKLELHPQKSKIISISRGVDFVGFRNFYYFRLLRKRNIRKMHLKITEYENNELSEEKLMESLQGWQAYAKWADTYQLRKRILKRADEINNLRIT